MYRKIILIIILLVLLSFSTSSIAQAVYISNSITNHYSYDLADEATFNAFMNYELEVDKRFNSISFYLTPEITYNFADEWDIDLAQAYLDAYLGDFDLRIGRQDINWGKADGFVITDIINPKDFSNYPVLEHEDQFQSIEAVKLNYYQGMNNYEVVWLPEFKGANLEEDLLLQQMQSEMGLTEEIEIDNSNLEPERKISNSEIAFRYSVLGRDFDYEIIAAYMWDNYPVLQIEEFNGAKQPTVIAPKHHRYLATGGSFSTIYNDWLIKGEGLFSYDKKYNTKNLAEYNDGVIAKNNLTWMLGVEYSLLDYLLNLQFRQEYLLDYEEDIVQDEFANRIMVSLQGQFLRNRLESKATLFYDLNRESLKLKPELGYDYTDQINFKLGMDYFLNQGDNVGLGMTEDVVYMQSEYKF